MRSIILKVKCYGDKIKEICEHEGNRNRILNGLLRSLWWFIRKHFIKAPKDVMVFKNRIFRCHVGGSHANSYFYHGTAYDSWHIMHFMENYLRPFDNFLDVGANVGLYSLLASSIINDMGKIIAIEPDPVSLCRFKEIIELNDIDNIELLDVAVSDSNGIGYLYLDGVGSHLTHGSEEKVDNTIKVKCFRLDDLIDNREFAICKLDVEGIELKVLKGAQSLIENGNLPIIILEANGLYKKYDISDFDILDFLIKNNYVLGTYDHDMRKLIIDNHLHEDTIVIRKDRINKIAKRIIGIEIRSVHY